MTAAGPADRGQGLLARVTRARQRADAQRRRTADLQVRLADAERRAELNRERYGAAEKLWAKAAANLAGARNQVNQLGLDHAEVQRQRNVTRRDLSAAQADIRVLEHRAKAAERRLAEQIDIAIRASNRHGLLNEPDLVAPGGTRDPSLAASAVSEDHVTREDPDRFAVRADPYSSPTAPGASAR